MALAREGVALACQLNAPLYIPAEVLAEDGRQEWRGGCPRSPNPPAGAFSAFTGCADARAHARSPSRSRRSAAPPSRPPSVDAKAACLFTLNNVLRPRAARAALRVRSLTDMPAMPPNSPTPTSSTRLTQVDAMPNGMVPGRHHPPAHHPVAAARRRDGGGYRARPRRLPERRRDLLQRQLRSASFRQHHRHRRARPAAWPDVPQGERTCQEFAVAVGYQRGCSGSRSGSGWGLMPSASNLMCRIAAGRRWLPRTLARSRRCARLWPRSRRRRGRRRRNRGSTSVPMTRPR